MNASVSWGILGAGFIIVMPLINEGIEIKNALSGKNKIHFAEGEIYTTTTSSQWGSVKTMENVKPSQSRAAGPNGDVECKVELPSEIKEVSTEQENYAVKSEPALEKIVSEENTNQNNSSPEDTTMFVPSSALGRVVSDNILITENRDDASSSADPREPIFA